MRIVSVYKSIILITTLLVLLTEFSFAARTKRQIVFEDERENAVLTANCRTPDRRPGRCVRLTSCTALLHGISRNMLRQYFCGFEGDEPRVCCPQPRVEVTTRRPASSRTTVRTTRRPTSRTTIRFEERVAVGPKSVSTQSSITMTKPPFLPDYGRENAVFTANCRTPDRRPGRCVRLTSCTALPHGISRNTLRQYFCGFEGDEPKICCPQPRVEVTTRRPTSSRATVRTNMRTTRRPTFRTTIRFEEERIAVGPKSVSTQNPNTMTKAPFLPDSCGVMRHTMVRVVGGSRADKGSWPWMAVVFVRRNNGALIPDCGGALVTNRHVITAAHCVVTGRRSTPLDPSRVVVRLGAHNLTIPNEPGAVDVEVEDVRRHEQFEGRTYKNDIAVLKLKRPVTFTQNISPVCLPYDSLRGEDLTRKSVIVTGYGTETFNGNASDVLMQALFYVQSQEACKAAYEPEIQITDVYMCAGMMDGSKDACQGDSGGPLVTIGKNSSYYLVGVVSFGKQCGQPNYPGVYANVTAYLDWLAVNMAD